MFNAVTLSDRRRNHPTNESREQRQSRFLRLAIFLAFFIAVAFGAILYTINTNGRL